MTNADDKIAGDQAKARCPGSTTVYYDGTCPLCRREIAFYRRQRGSEAIRWVNAGAGSSPSIAPDLSRAAALKRFHVRRPDGVLVSGASGFAALWAALPTFRCLGRLAGSPVFQPTLEVVYRVFLTARPLLQKITKPTALESI